MGTMSKKERANFFQTEAKRKKKAAHLQTLKAKNKLYKAAAAAEAFKDRNKSLEQQLTEVRASVLHFIKVQERWLAVEGEDALYPGDWVRAWKRLKQTVPSRGTGD